MNSNLIKFIENCTACKLQMLASKRLESLNSLLEFVNDILLKNSSIHVYADKSCLAAADHLYEELVVRYKSGAAFNREDRKAVCSYNYSDYSANRLTKLLKSSRLDKNGDLLVMFMAENSAENTAILQAAKAEGMKTFIIASGNLESIASQASWQFLVPTTDLSLLYHFQSLALHILCERLEPEFDSSQHGFESVLRESIELSKKVTSDPKLLKIYSEICEQLSASKLNAKSGRAIFFAGNGGSACDISSLLNQINLIEQDFLYSLHSTGALLAAYNDGYEPFARQLQASAKSEDVLIVYSTSGNSQNLIDAVNQAKSKSMLCIGLLGKDGGRLAGLCDYSLIVHSNETARIQEMHALMAAAIFDLVPTNI